MECTNTALILRIPEEIIGIAIPMRISGDASIAADAWIHGYLSTKVYERKYPPLNVDDDGDMIVYYSQTHNFTGSELSRLITCIQHYMEDDDPEPFLVKLKRSERYEYQGKVEP